MVCAENLGANIKVSNLAQMLPQAHTNIILVNDSDIRVAARLLAAGPRSAGRSQHRPGDLPLSRHASPTLGSRLEALGISTDFAAGVLAARQLEGGIRFGLGSTLAFRRRDLEAIGGFEAFVDYLADDYEIGKRIAERGLKVHAVRRRGRDFSSGVHVARICRSSTSLGTHRARFAALGISRAGADFWLALGVSGAVLLSRGAFWGVGLAGRGRRVCESRRHCSWDGPCCAIARCSGCCHCFHFGTSSLCWSGS